MNSTERSTAALGQAVTAEMDEHYTLVYVEQGQELPDDVVAALVRGDNEWETKGGEALAEWADDVRRVSAPARVDDLAKEIVRRWEREDSYDDTDAADYSDLIDDEWPDSDERIAAIETMLERDNSTWFSDLVNAHGAVLLRVSIATMDEDAGLSFKPITPGRFLDLLGFEHTTHNLATAAEAIDNASPEFSVVMGCALIAPDLDAIYELPAEGKVELRNPFVWFGNPFAGSGWCADDAFEGTLTVDRSALLTDADAFGYGWSEVVGGTHASYFAGEVAAVPATDDTDTETDQATGDTGPQTR